MLVSPCGKQLIEVAATDNGGRGADQFHPVLMARAIFEEWNAPVDTRTQPLVPLRVSRAVSADKFASMLAFYGVGGGGEGPSATASGLGFGSAKVLIDETDPVTKDRAVTIKLSPSATVHLQLWLRHEATTPPTTPAGPPLPSLADFAQAAAVNQINGRGPGAPQ